MTRSYFPSVDTETDESSPRSGAADSVRWRLERWFPRALVYREWRLNRLLYGATWLMMSYPIVHGGGDAFVSLDSNLTVYWVAVVVGLGTLAMRADRAGIAYVLLGGARRRDVLRVKAGFGVAVLSLTFFLPWLLYAATDSGPNGVWQPGVMAVGACTHLLALSAIYLTALAAACTVGNPLLAAAGAVLAAAVPAFVSVVLSFFFTRSYVLATGVGFTHWFAQLTTYLQFMSPLAAFTFGRSGPIVGPYLLWFATWCIAFWKLGGRLWEQVPVERMTETYWYPKLRYVAQAGAASVIAFIIARRIDGAGPRHAWILVFLVVFAVVWWMIRRVTRWTEGRRVGERA